MSERRMIRLSGWAFVAVQAALLITLIVLPGADAWPTPPWLRMIGAALVGVGLVVIAVASLGLGRSLTPTPVPNSRGELQVDGLYRFVRHPIYSGVLSIVVGLTLRSGSLVTLGLACATLAFFNTKAAWEEARLAERYPRYETYAAGTPRFIPRARRRTDRFTPDP